jgi:hypothetical protein
MGPNVQKPKESGVKDLQYKAGMASHCGVQSMRKCWLRVYQEQEKVMTILAERATQGFEVLKQYVADNRAQISGQSCLLTGPE